MVVALAGRRIDAEDAPSPRFPASQIENVRNKLHWFFIDKKPEWLVSSGACGADLIALDAAGESGIKRKMVLPFEGAKFRKTSVIDRPGNWGELFDKIYQELTANSNVVDANYQEDDENVYEKANFDILNTADAVYKESTTKTGKLTETDNDKKVAIIIWEGQPKSSNDTTDHFRQEAIKRNYEIIEINSLH